MAADPHARAVRELFDDGEVREVLRETFYRAEAPSRTVAKTTPEAETSSGKRKRVQKPKPDHYEIICISMYKEDLARLDEKVAALKSRGHRRMTRSALIRWALDQIENLETVPRGI
ncbi:hypothetical protein [Sandaracinus amylolyticus]|uniref:hypothetical protein n=1 Tax=Sandaracinus amylolyticus TaxID=927083 RepID=UPI001F223F8C|nr:hypothetical protein [Sandaracinus amylolyticus]UJR80737.1 Hypothetical protein I5071_27870 [Sandaracinus amylolyticus]